MAFTETFGGTTIYPSDVSYRSISLSANQTLSWPLEVATSGNVVAQIMDVTPSAGGFTITMPPGNEASPGETALFFNAGAHNFTVADNLGNTIVSIAPGLAYQVYLTTNTTVAGTWRTTQFGAGTSSATAGSLVGYGIKAINTTLNQSMAVTSLAVNYTAGAADRSAAFLWTGGAGIITLPAASTVGNDWFFHIRNGGTGAISLATTGGELINGTATVDFNPGDSAIIVCDGTGYFTIGFGQAPEFLFDYVSIDLTSQSSPYTLAGSNLNRIAYQFSGTLTTNMQIIVPATIQQYWVGNFTTGGSYTLTIKTSGGTGVIVPRDARSILYCNGTDVVNADTGGISIPILVSQGGTGATNASAARTNLGATSIGNALFTAVDEATARNAIIAAKSGANSDITSLSGLTTPLSVAQGGTGAATFTANGLVYGSGTSALGVTAAGTNGQVLVGNTGGAPSWATLSGIGVTSFSAGTTGLTPSSATSGAITLSGTLVVANGGTGATTLTGYVKGNGTSALTASATIPATDISGGAALTKVDDTNVTLTLGGTPASALLAATSLTLGWTGQLSVARGGTGQSSYTDGQLLIGNSTGNTLTKATLTAGTNVSITNGAGSITINATDQFVGTVTSVSGTGTVNGITLTGTVTSSGSLTLGGTLSGVSLTTQVTGTLPVANGGTGATTLTANGVLLGNGTSAISATAVGATGQVLVGNTGGAPSWATLTGIGVTSFSAGTTGLTPNSATTGAITLAGTLGVANGGTGATTLTSGYLVKGNGTSAVSASVVYDDGTNVGIGTSSPGGSYGRLTVAGGIRTVDDTSSKLELGRFSAGAPNSYIKLGPNSGSLRFTDAGDTADLMTLTNAGNVGIGTTSPGSRLDVRGVITGGDGTIQTVISYLSNAGVTGTLTNHPYVFYANNAERMRIDASGNVGIGTSSFAYSAANRGLIQVNGTTTAFYGLSVGGTGVGYLAGASSNIELGATGYTSFVNNSAERMRIDSSGNVGIGTSSFTNTVNNFVVRQSGTGVDLGGSASTAAIRVRGTSGGAGLIDFYPVSSDPNSSPFYLGRIFYDNASNFMALHTNSAERMRIDSSGNASIGTTTGAARLRVAAAGAVNAPVLGNVTNYPAFFSNSDAGYGLGVGTSAGDGHVWLQAQRSDSATAYNITLNEAGGNVGIGTASPGAVLQLNKASGAADLRLSVGGTLYSNIYASSSDVNILSITAIPLIFGTNNTERARIDSSGNFYVNCTTAGAGVDGLRLTSSNVAQFSRSNGDCISANRNGSDGQVAVWYRSGTAVGSISVTGSATAYNTSSDYRLKDIDGPIANSGAYIDALKPVQGSWKADGSRFIGLLAHEVQEVSETPIATGEKDGEKMQAMDYSAPEIIANLIAEVQSLRARVAQLEGN